MLYLRLIIIIFCGAFFSVSHAQKINSSPLFKKNTNERSASKSTLEDELVKHPRGIALDLDGTILVSDSKRNV